MSAILASVDLTKESEIFSQEVLGENLPWYWTHSSVNGYDPFFSHVIVKRSCNENEQPEILSPLFQPMVELLKEFVKKSGIKFTTVHRACLNCIVGNANPLTTAHVDYAFPHNIFLLYFTESNGDTIVYEKTYQQNDLTFIPHEEMNNIKTAEIITPQIGKAVAFNGAHFHAIKTPKPEQGRRIVLVVCFS